MSTDIITELTEKEHSVLTFNFKRLDIKYSNVGGYIYVVSFEKDLLKIGKTRKPFTRLKTLLTISPNIMTSFYISKPILKYQQFERDIFNELKPYWHKQEYYKLSIKEAIEKIELLNKGYVQLTTEAILILTGLAEMAKREQANKAIDYILNHFAPTRPEA